MSAWYFHGRTVSYLLLYLYYGRLICSMQTIYILYTHSRAVVYSEFLSSLRIRDCSGVDHHSQTHSKYAHESMYRCID